MTATSSVIDGIKLAYDDGHYENISLILSLDMRQGNVSGSTRWLDGAAGAADDYPGKIDGFRATNTETTNTAGGSLRMLVIEYDKTRTNADDITFSANDSGTGLIAPFTKIVAVLGHTTAGGSTHDYISHTDTVLTHEAQGGTTDNNRVTLLLE